MRITLNGAPAETEAGTLARLLEEMSLADAVVATALNGAFIAREARAATPLAEGDAVEVVAPLAGG